MMRSVIEARRIPLEATIERAVEEALADARRTLKKQVDADAEELKKAIDEA